MTTLLAVAMATASGCGDDDDAGGDGGRTATNEAAADVCGIVLEGTDFAGSSETSGRTVDGFNYRECIAEAPSGGELAVGVIDSDERYRSLDKSLARAPGRERVEALGEEAFVANGFSSEERGGTSGRTVYIDDGERTVVVALDPGSRENSGADVVNLAKLVLAGLG